MKIVKSLAIAAGIAGLAACGGGEQNTAENLDANLTDLNAGMDMNATDMNAMDMNATDLNATMNADANAAADMNATANTDANANTL